METYQYKYGDQPLERYTIQRAVGRGGFGEVYYAINAAGRQVALKVVQDHEEIELRGIRQCMNLKNPHLVTIFDIKNNRQGKPFVIMEYVSGPSLADLLRESPAGLGTQKAAFFLQEIGKGLSFLHECGIVHRDLKPGNIFYEKPYVKIGDYGLAKAIGATSVSQTITVGTVQYMAPEIATGRYDRSIDIYALGVLLYEMLTGHVPFCGSSPANILAQHMTAVPDLTNIEEPFSRVIRKALAKDPAERHQSVQEMIEDVFGAEHVRNSVSQFSPEDLSVIADRIALKRGDDEPQPPRPTPAPDRTGSAVKTNRGAQVRGQEDEPEEDRKHPTASGDAQTIVDRIRQWIEVRNGVWTPYEWKRFVDDLYYLGLVGHYTIKDLEEIRDKEKRAWLKHGGNRPGLEELFREIQRCPTKRLCLLYLSKSFGGPHRQEVRRILTRLSSRQPRR